MKKNDLLKAGCYVYLLLPMIVFLLGWTKTYLVGLPLSLAIILSLYAIVRKQKNDIVNKYVIVKNDILKIIVIIIFILTWVYISGIGGFVWQNPDHQWRNEIFDILVRYRWPAVRGTVNGTRGIAYYIGFWMIPALVGKVFGTTAGFLAQYIWAAIGILLLYGLICRRFNKIVVFPLLIFVLWGGLDIVGFMISDYSEFTAWTFGEYLESYYTGYDFSSFTFQLFWVFNQSISAWLITLLVIDEKSNDGIVLLMATGLLSSPFPMVGLFPISLFIILRNSKGRLVTLIRDIFSFENITGFLCAIVLGMLYFGNAAISLTRQTISLSRIISIIALLVAFVVFLKYIKDKKKNLLNAYFVLTITLAVLIVAVLYLGNNGTLNAGNELTSNNSVGRYLFFLLMEIGGYILFTVKDNKKNYIYMIAVMTLFVSPLIVVGTSIDFCMRVSIPGLLILYLSFCDSVQKAITNQKKLLLTMICMFFIISAIDPINEIARPFVKYDEYKEHRMVSVQEQKVFEGVNFSTDIDTNLFYKYLARY